ncbi:MAG: arginine deiminase-related protein [Chthoniobacterales bacterium]
MKDLAQSARAVLMVRPHRFHPNPETASDNAFQQSIGSDEISRVALAAEGEFDRAVATLRGAGVTVHVIDDTPTPEKPDAVFPNNWFSTHHDGRVVFYPMHSPTRRRERRPEVVDELWKHYRVNEVVDYSLGETEGHFLEGTGSLVLDYANRLAYASLSQRTHPEMVDRFCADFGFVPVKFHSATADGRAVYHTNVLMCIGSDFALAGLSLIPDAGEREEVRAALAASGREVIELSTEQISEYAGNALELDNGHEKLLVLSARAEASLGAKQRAALARHTRLVPLALPTIELAGGSARCMLAAIHLPPRA